MLKEQVGDSWGEIRKYVEAASFNGISEHKLAVMLEMLLSGRMQCWVGVDDDKNFMGIVLTQFGEDYVGKTLVVMSLFAKRSSTLAIWYDGIETLKRFARANGCYKIVAQVNDERYVKLLERIGADASIRIVTFDV